MLQLLQLNPPEYKNPFRPNPRAPWAGVYVSNEEQMLNDIYRNHGEPENWTGIIFDSEMTKEELIPAFLDNLPSDSSMYSENLAWDRTTPNNKGRIKLLSKKELLENLYLWKIEDESIYPLEKAENRILTLGDKIINYYIFPTKSRFEIRLKVSLDHMAKRSRSTLNPFINYDKGTI